MTERRPEAPVRLVLQPDTPYLSLAETLGRHGWEAAVPATSLPSLRPGEPELAEWRRAAAAAGFVYTFNPAVSLRVIEVTSGGADVGAELAAYLPIMSDADLLADMQSDEVRALIRGLLAVAEVRLVGALPFALALCTHSDERVAGAARRSSEILSREAGAAGGRHLRERMAREPDGWVSPAARGEPELRRQLLRLAAADPASSGPLVRALAQAGLKDPDWEVRVTAMLATARLSIAELADAVRAVRIPGSGIGLDRDEHRLLELLERLCHGLLVGRVSYVDSIEGVPRAELLNHLRRAVLGQAVETQDRAFLFVHSFMVPVERPSAALDSLLAEVERSPDGYRLGQSGHAVVWVPPTTYWLGQDPAPELPNPIRCIEPGSGFFVLKDPGVLGEPCGFDEAMRRCAKLGEMEGLRVRPPTANEWEMALRGPDGRLYPWGNGLPTRESSEPLGSSLGFAIREPQVGEWAFGDSGDEIVCGGGKMPRCARRARPATDARHLIRPLIAAG